MEERAVLLEDSVLLAAAIGCYVYYESQQTDEYVTESYPYIYIGDMICQYHRHQIILRLPTLQKRSSILVFALQSIDSTKLQSADSW